MSLEYDFDIFDLNPETVQQDDETKGFLARLGLGGGKVRSGMAPDPDAGPNRVALFRDPRTADALRDAPHALRAYFLGAGFGLNTYSSGAGRHFYPASDEDARLEIIERLTALAAAHSLPGLGDYAEGGDVFRIGAFLADLAEARPVPVAALPINALSQGDTGAMPALDAAPRRKFWQGRFFVAAAIVGGAVALLQISASFGFITLASL